jgi:hypothetical protein
MDKFGNAKEVNFEDIGKNQDLSFAVRGFSQPQDFLKRRIDIFLKGMDRGHVSTDVHLVWL